jgi:hypothetical protein
LWFGAGAGETNAGRILRETSECVSTKCDSSENEFGALAPVEFKTTQLALHDSMTRSRSEASVSSNECSAESFGRHYIGGIKGRKIVTELPNAHEMRIASDPQVQQIANRFVRTV